MRVDDDGVIVLFDSDDDNEDEEVSDVVAPSRRRPTPAKTRVQQPNKRVKLATGRPSASASSTSRKPPPAPALGARRSSAIQASAVTAALVDVANEESSSESSSEENKGGRYLSYSRSEQRTAPRGRTKRGAAVAHKQQPTKPAGKSNVWSEYTKKKKGLSASSVRNASSGNESSSSSSSSNSSRDSYRRKRGGVRRRIDVEEEEEEEGESSLSGQEAKDELDSDDVFDFRRSLPTGKPTHRPSNSKAKASPTRAPTKQPLSSSGSQPKYSQQSKQHAQQYPKPTEPAVSLAVSSYAHRQAERLSEVVSLGELQAQERAFARFHAQKKRAEAEAAAVTGSSGAKSARRGEPVHSRKAPVSHTSTGPNSRSSSVASSTTSKAHSVAAANLARSKSRSKAAAKKSATPLPDLSAELLISSSLRSTASTSASRRSHSMMVSGNASTAASLTPAAKPVAPVVHSTSWRGVYFSHAPSNLLTEVPIVPYSSDFDCPLTAYDPTGTLVNKCALVDADEGKQSPSQSIDESSVSSDGVAASPSVATVRPQEEMEAEVRDALAAERELIEQCHKQRVRHIVQTTRAHVAAYLNGIHRLRGDPFEPFRRCDLASHQLSLGLSPIERTAAKRALHSAAPPKGLNSLVGSVCYYIQVGEPRETASPSFSMGISPPTPMTTETAVYPETVIHLADNLTPLRRASTYIGVRKSVFIEDDPVLRYVPYFGEQAQMSIDPKRYSATTLDKEKRITILGQHAAAPDLKFIEPSARDHEVTECLLRAVVHRCGRNDHVFAALTSVSEANSRAKQTDSDQRAADDVDDEAAAADWLSSFRFVQPEQDYKEIVEWVTSERRAKKLREEIRAIAKRRDAGATAQPTRAKYLDRFTRSCWYLQDLESDVTSLTRRLAPPVTNSESNLARFPTNSGLRDSRAYEDAKEWFRDLFCRRCYSYDCEEHGILQPGPLHRVDPMLPAVHAPGVNLTAKQETKTEEVVIGNGGGEEVIELDDSSNSSDSGSGSNGRGKSTPNDEAQPKEEQKEEGAHDGDGDGDNDEEEEEDDVAPRRSVRSQTRICSLASASLQVQEQMVERKRRRQLREQRRRLERLLRANDDSEYIDDSFRPVVDAAMDRLKASDPDNSSAPCSAACWKGPEGSASSAIDEGDDALPAVDEMLVTKLSRSLNKTEQSDACLLTALINRPELTCARVGRFLAQRAAHTVEQREKEDAAGLRSADSKNRDQRRQHKHDKRRRSSSMSSGSHGNRSGKRASTASSSNVNQLNRGKEHRYIPCNHPGPCTRDESGANEEGESCACVEREHKCDRACACPRDCPQRFHGCRCLPGGCRIKSCPCFSAGRECDPDYCFSCGAGVAAVLAFQAMRPPASAAVCGNVHLLRGRAQKKVGVAFSATHGWGAFALEPIRKGEFVYEYVGGIVSDDEAERRGSIYEMLAVSYLFDVNAEQVVDAMRQGNKIKFANHRAATDGANCETKISTVSGEHRIALFARQDIEVGTELFFDYGYTHDTAPDWSQRGMRNPHRWDDHDDEDDLNDDWRRELGIRLE